MAYPLKTGADLYNQQLIRARIQNLGAPPNGAEVRMGQIYFNSSDDGGAARRLGYCYEDGNVPKFHHIANLADIQRLEDLIAELDFASSGDFTALIKRVESVEGNFTDGKANDSAKLGGQLPSYYATQSAFSALQEKVNAFLNGDVDSDAVLENLKEIQAFLDNYDGATSLADMFDAVDAKLADRYTKGESDARYLQLTGGTMTGNIVINYSEFGENTAYGGFVRFGSNYLHITNDAAYYNWNTLLHTGNYSDLITKINGDLSIGGSVNANYFRMANNLIAMSYVNIGTGRLYIGYGTTTENQAETYIWGKKLGVVNPSGQTLFDIDENGNVHVTGNLIVEGEVSAKGKGQEGGENTGGGFQLFDETNSWDSYEASMQDWILTAYHGKLFNDRISLLENKATKVEVSNLLSSGTKIATIKVDNNSYDVLAPFADAYTKTESDARYLKLSGGTINGSLEVGNAEGYICLNNQNKGTRGYFTYNEDFDWYVTDNGWQHEYKLLHLGNFNSYAPTLTGVGASGTWGIDISGSAAKLGGIAKDGFQQSIYTYFSSDSKTIPDETTLPNILSYGSWGSGFGYVDTKFYLEQTSTANRSQVVYGYTADFIKFRRYNNGTWLPWKTIAFTDSDITGNAASATKLETAVSLWGNEFNGTQSLNGSVTLDKNAKINLGEKGIIQYVGVSNSLYIGYETCGDWNTYVWGKNVSLTNINGVSLVSIKEDNRVILGYASAMTITEDGKVLVGDNTNTLSATLKSVGLTHLAGVSSAPVLGNVTKIGLAIGANAYGMQHWVDGSGQGNIQAGRFDGTATAYALNLNPLGGNVGIGTTNPNYKLHVDGDGYFSSNLYIGGHIVSKLSDFYMFYDSSKIFLQAGPAGVFLGEGTQDTTYLSLHGKFIRMVTNGVEKMRITEDGTVSFYNNVHVNTRLLIGGASDDGSTALQVTGELKVSRLSNTNHTYLRINSSDNLVNYIGHDLDDGFCSHKFMSHDNTLMVLSGHPSGISTIYTPLDIHGTTRILNYLIADATTLASLIVNNAATFNGGVDIPMGQSLKIGDATIKYEGGALKVDKSIHSEGEVSAKGKGTEGAGGTTEGGGNAMKAAFNIPMGSQSHICEHNFHTREVTVCIYEDSGDYQQVLADVYLDDENNVRIQFGSPTDVPHRVIIMA